MRTAAPALELSGSVRLRQRLGNRAFDLRRVHDLAEGGSAAAPRRQTNGGALPAAGR